MEKVGIRGMRGPGGSKIYEENVDNDDEEEEKDDMITRTYMIFAIFVPRSILLDSFLLHTKVGK